MAAVKALAVSLLLFSTLPAGAVTLDQWGTQAVTASTVCAEPCDPLSFLLGISVDPADVDGGPQVLSADSVLTPGTPDVGTAHSAVTVTGSLQIPELRAEAFSTAAGGTLAVAVGAQAYRYLGGTGTVSVTVDLTGAIENPGDSTNTGLAVAVALFTPGSGFSLEEPVDIYGPLGPSLILALDLYEALASVELEHHASNAALADLGHVLTINGLAADDTFYLFASIIASADGDTRFADAFSTVSLQFSEGGDALEVAAVPLPAGVCLFGPALAGLLVLRRRAAV